MPAPVAKSAGAVDGAALASSTKALAWPPSMKLAACGTWPVAHAWPIARTSATRAEEGHAGVADGSISASLFLSAFSAARRPCRGRRQCGRYMQVATPAEAT